jgi:hypothetical protein
MATVKQRPQIDRKLKFTGPQRAGVRMRLPSSFPCKCGPVNAHGKHQEEVVCLPACLQCRMLGWLPVTFKTFKAQGRGVFRSAGCGRDAPWLGGCCCQVMFDHNRGVLS